MYICPKCGKYMTWYMKYYCGVPFGGWTCGCGYDTNLWSNTIATNRTICYGECAARKTENSSVFPNNCDGCKEGQEDCYGCPFVKQTEPQYDFGEYADRLWEIAYERGKREALEQTESKTEPTWEQLKEYCNKRCLDIVDSAMRKQWYKDEPQTEREGE